ncbi:hypothetical protein ACFQ9X_17355 [Catenulispora yoronensis]
MASSAERRLNSALTSIRGRLQVVRERIQQLGQVRISMLGFKGVGKSTLLWAMFNSLDDAMKKPRLTAPPPGTHRCENHPPTCT